MGFEAPYPLPPATRPDVPKKEPQEEREKLPLLSPEELVIFAQEIESLAQRINSFTENGEGSAGRGVVRELQKTLEKNPEYIRLGLHHSETRTSTLCIISCARNFPIDWHKDFQAEAAKAPEHYAEKVRQDRSFFVQLNDAVLQEGEQIEADLDDEKNKFRGLALNVVSGMLASPEPRQREYAEKMMMRRLPLLQELLFEKFNALNKAPITSAWQNMLLRLEQPENLKKTCGRLKVTWEANENKDWVDLYRNIFRQVLESRDSKSEFNRDFILKKAVDLTGLDGSKVMRSWMLAGDEHMKEQYGPSHQYAYGRNLRALYELRQESPEVPRILYEDFGITHFGRYPTPMLLRQVKKAESDEPYGLVIYPESDYNGAFFQTGEKIFYASLQLQSGGLETRVVEANSQRDLTRKLLRLHKKYSLAGNKFAFAIVGGHGSKDSVTLGEEKIPTPPPLPDSKQSVAGYADELSLWQEQNARRDRERFITKDIVEGKGIGRALEEWFEEGAPKILVSCSTGIEGGIAETVSARTSGEVSAPKIPTNVEKIDVHVDENGKISFSVKYIEGETGRYAAGKPVEK